MSLCRGAALLAFTFTAAQLPSQTTPAPGPQTLTTSTTLVVVPTLVRDRSGNPVFSLRPEDFTLTDNGKPQELRLEQDSDSQPLALVVDIEGGHTAIRELAKFSAIAPMIESIVGSIPARIAVVGFDSAPVLVTGFTIDREKASQAVEQLLADNNGDDGAAILDSIQFSVDLLRTQLPQYRRAILLISETNGDTSRIGMKEAVRTVTDTNTIIYSVAFSTGKSNAGVVWSGLKHPAPPPGGTNTLTMKPELDMAQMALTFAIESLHQNVPETVARLTGGEYFQFLTRKDLARDLVAVSNRIPNRYVLTFQPIPRTPGLHVLKLGLKNYPDLRITARTSYWAQEFPVHQP